MIQYPSKDKLYRLTRKIPTLGGYFDMDTTVTIRDIYKDGIGSPMFNVVTSDKREINGLSNFDLAEVDDGIRISKT